jgi:hypothetical protein
MVLRVQQRPNQIVDISDWSIDADHPIYPEGSQPKRLLVSPAEARFPFLLPSHKYLFKAPKGWQINQIWSELISYELTRFLDVSVPPTFLAVDRRTGEFGVLSEFFYGYAGEGKKRLIPGSDHIHGWLHRHYDRKKGRPHPIRANLTIARSRGIDNYARWWGRTLMFDALIGNVDRHPDNWGVIATPIQGPNYHHELAPLFDNGTSLAYGVTDAGLAATLQNLDAHIAKGRHHCSWEADSMRGTPHIQMCGQYRRHYYPTGVPAEFVIRFTDDAIDSIVDWCLDFREQIEFHPQRAIFVRAAFRRRRELLTAPDA